MEGTNVSRRDFLRGAGVVGAAAGAFAVLGGAQTAVAADGAEATEAANA